MATVTYTRCEHCGGINTLDTEEYKCSTCGAFSRPEKAIHIKKVENDDGSRRKKRNWAGTTYGGWTSTHFAPGALASATYGGGWDDGFADAYYLEREEDEDEDDLDLAGLQYD